MKVALVGLLGLCMLKGCDMGDPASVQPKMEDALRPYFPKVKAVALPQQHALVGLSCIENVGDEMVKMVAPAVASNPAMSQLKLLRFLPGSSYKLVAIGFEQGLAFYDVENGSTGTTVGDSSYATWYRQECGLNQNSNSNSGPNIHAWIGYFSGAVDCSDGQRKVVNTTDTLGIWANREFLDRHLDAQIDRVTKNWSDSWSRQRCTLSSVKLEAVRDVPVPISPGN